MIGFIDFKDSLKKAPKKKLVQIANLLDMSINGTKNKLYLMIVAELGTFYEEHYYVDIEEINEKIFNILNNASRG